MSKPIHDLSHLSAHDGSLYIESVNVNDLAERYGTPLYVYSKARLLANYDRMKTAFKKAGIDVRIHYAVKTNSNLAILHLMREAGAGVDVSCSGEMDLAHHAGFPLEKIIYSGNNNPDEELCESLKKVGITNLDHYSFLPRLLKYGRPAVLSLRINPGFGKGSHSSNVFAGKESKFGVDEEAALYGYQLAKKAGIRRSGIHTMPGSGVIDDDFFPKVAEKIFEVAERIAKKAHLTFEFIDVGGGFGIPYKDDEKALNMDRIATEIGKIYREYIKKGTVGKPQLFTEPGRYIVGDAGILLGRVHGLKEEYHRFAGIDAGMNTLMRPALHGSHHHIVCANKMAARKKKAYRVCGRICENTDQHPGERLLPGLEVGDLLAILNVGAYGYSMASVFNNYGRPAEVMVSGTKHAVIRKRETFEDLKRLMVVHSL